jgi:hypothetical protein
MGFHARYFALSRSTIYARICSHIHSEFPGHSSPFIQAALRIFCTAAPRFSPPLLFDLLRVHTYKSSEWHPWMDGSGRNLGCIGSLPPFA